MLADEIYVRITRNLIRVKSLKSGLEATGVPETPFTTARLLVGDFAAAEKTLKAAMAQVRGKSFLALPPSVLMHPLERVEGGLSPIEERVFRELAMATGAKKVVIWIGAELADPQVSAKLKGGAPL